jgi:hypothetical protein
VPSSKNQLTCNHFSMSQIHRTIRLIRTFSWPPLTQSGFPPRAEKVAGLRIYNEKIRYVHHREIASLDQIRLEHVTYDKSIWNSPSSQVAHKSIIGARVSSPLSVLPITTFWPQYGATLRLRQTELTIDITCCTI